jgi:WD40-like Beta Propeller Repeat
MNRIKGKERKRGGGLPKLRLCSAFLAANPFVLIAALGNLFLLNTALAGDSNAGDPPTPNLSPDYAGIVLPPNIAPLNFRIEEPGTRYRVEFHSSKGRVIEIEHRSAIIEIPPEPWHTLLRDNAGEPLFVNLSVRNSAGTWTRYVTITNQIAKEPIDKHLAYRLLGPLYNEYLELSIYQRDLESFEQRPILENSRFGRGCVNCHSFLNRRPDIFAVQIRNSSQPPAMLLVRSNEVARVDKTMGYLSWHPSGRLLAFSANKLSLFFHTRGETRDVYDASSDLGIYRVDSNTVVFPPPISRPDRNETWPGWSADGRHLYYSSAPPLPREKFRRIRYDLMRVRYDIDHDVWGEPETVLSAQETGLSACQPKASPDGRYLLFTMCAYGNFPIYQASSDLYLMDLATRVFRRLEINSDQADSWHSWSSNSRWIVFSSKRIDGLFARPFFSYVDAQGRFHKPFVLPQADPTFYESYLKTFNVPELVQGPVVFPELGLAKAILNPRNVLTPQADSKYPTPASAQGTRSGSEPAYRPARE